LFKLQEHNWLLKKSAEKTKESGALTEWYTEGKTKFLKRETGPCATFSTTKPAQSGTESNPVIRGEKPDTGWCPVMR
jgi:hypothetical protein